MKIQQKNIRGVELGRGDQGGYGRRIEDFVKIQKTNSGGGGGGGVRVRGSIWGSGWM